MVQSITPILFPPLLLATDGSASALLAQKMVCRIAQLLHAKEPEATAPLLTVMSVSPRPRRQLGSVRRLGHAFSKKAVLVENQEQTDQAATLTKPPAGFVPSVESLAALLQDDLPKDFPMALELRQGRPAVEILSYARTVQAGLIAVGHRGSGGMRELLLGSVSTAIARYSPCSVLVARNPATAVAAPTFAHVLLVVDPSTATQTAIAATQQLANLGIERITLLYIHPPLNANHLLGPFAAHTPNWQLDQSLHAAQRERGEDILQRATAALHTPAIAIQTLVRTGDPGPAICQVATEQATNLIILGSDPTRRSLLSHLHVQRRVPQHPEASTSRSVLRNTRLSVTEDYTIHYAPCPVLLCRPPTDSTL